MVETRQSGGLSGGIGGIYAQLALCSARPRYAILVLQLVAEAADRQGRAGPFVREQSGPILLRDWLCTQLMPLSERDGRRKALRERVSRNLAGQLSGDPKRDEAMIAAAVEEQVLTVGRANVSRAISDLVKAGLVRRHYAGYATAHANRGGGRHAVYTVESQALAALRRGGASPAPLAAAPKPAPRWNDRQGQLFAA